MVADPDQQARRRRSGPNDPDGNAWGDTKLGFPPPLKKAGYTVIDPGRFPDLNDNFSSQLAKFKSRKAQIVTGVPIPPDFTTFWTQALQQGFHPKIASVGKALLFPSSVEALGTHGEGMSTELWWSPFHPYKSSLTGQTAAQLAAAWERKNGQWTQPVGFAHGLFEVAADVLRRTKNIDDKASIVDAIKATNLDTVVGHISWKNGPVPNVAKTQARRRPMAQGQEVQVRAPGRQQQAGAWAEEDRQADSDPVLLSRGRACPPWSSSTTSRSPSARCRALQAINLRWRRARRSGSWARTGRARRPC